MLESPECGGQWKWHGGDSNGRPAAPSTHRRVPRPTIPEPPGSLGVAMATDAGSGLPDPPAGISHEAHRRAANSRAPMESWEDTSEGEKCWRSLENLELAIEQCQLIPR